LRVPCLNSDRLNSSMSRKPVHFLQCDPGSASTRKRRHLDRGAPVMAGATAATATRLASRPVVEPAAAVESGGSAPSSPLHPPTLSDAAAFADGNSVAQSCPPSGLATPSSHLTFSIHSDLALPTPAPPLDELGMAHSLAMLNAESQAVGLRQSQAMQNDSQTGATYARHLKRYRAWWASYQAACCADNPRHTRLPPFPLTPDKVVLFLEHETTREKVHPPLPECALGVLSAHPHTVFSSASVETQPRQSLDRQSGDHLSHRPSARSRNGAATTSTCTRTTVRLRRPSENLRTSETWRQPPNEMSQSALRAHRPSKQQAPPQVCNCMLHHSVLSC
jgi:hypothetical protein